MREPYQKPVLVRHRLGALNPFARPQVTLPGGRLDGFSPDDLVARHGSPLFVISEAELRRRYRELDRAFRLRYPRTTIGYSYKTNYLSAICAVLRQEGAWAEVVSGFEYDIALALGVPGSEIIFNGPMKRRHELEQAVADGALIHADSLEEVADLEAIGARLGRRIPIGLRVNMRLTDEPWDRFGFNLENGDARQMAARVASSPSLRLSGLHTHVGTYITDVDVYARAAVRVAELCADLRRGSGVELDHLDFGGGFAARTRLHGQALPVEHVVPSIDRYAEALTSALMRGDFPVDRLPRLIIEPGRALVAEAVQLITSVVSCKRLSDGRRGLVLDAGVNLLPTSWWYEFDVMAVKETSGVVDTVNLYGPMCMNIDCLRQNVPLPPVGAGDLLVVRNVGAYNLAQSMQFIQLRPAVVMLGDGGVELVREAETAAYARQLEHVPVRLVSMPAPDDGAPSPREDGARRS
ncbi:MAG: diaminopimelate decarboxylase [Proteobacteria bacterium]|nr:diaminopimelate decarboxylase [Pseudomonadota bacterium]